MADGFSACHPCFMPDLRTASGYHLAGACGWTRFMAKTRQPQATLLGVASKRPGISTRIQPGGFVFTASLLQRRMGYLHKQTVYDMAEIAITPESIFDCVPLIQEAIRSKSRAEYRALLYLLSLAEDFDAALTLTMAFGCPAAEESLINKKACFPYWEEALRYKPEWGHVRRKDYGNPFFREIALFPNQRFYSRFLELCPPRDEIELRSLYDDVHSAQKKFLTREASNTFSAVRSKLEERLLSYSIPRNSQVIITLFEIGAEYAVVETAANEEGSTYCKLISLQGEPLLPCNCDLILSMNERFFYVLVKDGQRRVWDLKERVFLDEKYHRRVISVLFPDEKEYLPVYIDDYGNNGLLLASGALLEHASHKSIQEYGPYILVADNASPGGKILDRQGNEIIPSEYDSIVLGDNPIQELDMFVTYDYGVIPVERSGEWFYVDKNNKPVSDKAYSGLCPYAGCGYAIFEGASGNLGVIDRAGEIILSPEYKRLNWVGPTTLIAEIGDETPQLLISPLGENLLPEGWTLDFPDEPYVFVKQNGRRAIFTQSSPGGRFDTLLFESKTRLIPENGCFIQFTKKNKKRLMGYDGTPLLKKTYDDICINPDRTRVVVRDGIRWFVLDNQGNALNELIIKE